MKLGIDCFSLRFNDWNAFELLDYANRIGIDVVHFSEHEPLESLDTSYLEKVKEYADELGIDIEMGMWSICPTSTAFRAEDGTAVEQLSQMLDVAKVVDSPALRCVIGTNDEFYGLGAPNEMMKMFNGDKAFLAVDNLPHTWVSQKHLVAWRMWLRHTFCGRGIPKIEVESQKSENTVRVAAAVSSPTPIQGVTLFHAYNPSTDWRFATWFGAPMASENGRYAAPPWYGQFWPQLLLALLMGLVFASTLIGFLIRYPREKNPSLTWLRSAISLCGLLLLIVFGLNLAVLLQTGQLPGAVWPLQLLSVVTATSVFIYLFKNLQFGLSTRRFSKEDILFTLVSLALLYFIFYWNVP